MRCVKQDGGPEEEIIDFVALYVYYTVNYIDLRRAFLVPYPQRHNRNRTNYTNTNIDKIPEVRNKYSYNTRLHYRFSDEDCFLPNTFVDCE